MTDKYRITKDGRPHMIEHKDLSLHDALSELHHTVKHDGIMPTVKGAMNQGYRIEKVREHKTAEEARHSGHGSHDPSYENSKKNK